MIPGIDVSHYQRSIDWVKVAAAGIRFAYIKATQGASFVDPRLEENVIGATAAGIPFGLYHVFLANTGNSQMENWRKQRDRFPSRLPAWLDVEPGSITEGTVPQVLEFLDTMFDPSDCVYCSLGTAQSFLADPEFQYFELAIAHYTEAPQPNVVSWPDWLFWQHSSVGVVDGITTSVDLDWFNGDEEAFQKLLGVT
jgi:lysozyme